MELQLEMDDFIDPDRRRLKIKEAQKIEWIEQALENKTFPSHLLNCDSCYGCNTGKGLRFDYIKLSRTLHKLKRTRRDICPDNDGWSQIVVASLGMSILTVYDKLEETRIAVEKCLRRRRWLFYNKDYDLFDIDRVREELENIYEYIKDNPRYNPRIQKL